ncbi:MAG: ABC transporter ATP-binding protein [Desulfobacterium sp.]|nr:ABC transporter ATP-binding protein [Desulfobacterium sp.]
MLRFVKRMLDFAGPYKNRLRFAFLFSFFESLFVQVPLFLVLYTLLKISADRLVVQDAWRIGAVLVVSVVLRAVFLRLVDTFETTTGYQMFADERMRMGDRLKRLPMGYFSEGAIGDVTAVITSDITFIEQYGMIVLAKIVSAGLGMVITASMLMVIDFRIGMVVAGVAMGVFAVQSLLQKKGSRLSSQKQEIQSTLVGAVLEFVSGMHVIKAFNITGERAEATRKGFRKTRDILIQFEKQFIPPFIVLDICLAAGSASIICLSAIFAMNRTMDPVLALVLIVFSFELFAPFKIIAGSIAQTKVAEAGLDRYEAVMGAEIIDENAPPRELNRFDVEFRQVCFAYDTTPVIHDMSFTIPENSMTALVGRSGCGKSTVANLITRFWDPGAGEIRIGGINIREMSCDSLLKHISMVFQTVYLFNDSILNNIRLGKPEATMEEVIAVCKKARCHDFITALEKGYHTMVGEGGSTLSGGEKQRVSIARAMLKDAPIILLDEATASVDPDNERHLQEAISELVKQKTLVVIAHRLSTVRNADQILVMDHGRIVESGRHDQLVSNNGLYQDLWDRRIQAKSWKMLPGFSNDRAISSKAG